MTRSRVRCEGCGDPLHVVTREPLTVRAVACAEDDHGLFCPTDIRSCYFDHRAAAHGEPSPIDPIREDA